MADATKYMVAVSPEEEQGIVDDVASQMKAHKLRLISLVQSVGPYITSDDLIQQAKAVQYMSAIITQLEPSTLMGHDISLMVRFYTSRLEIPNVPGVRETAHGLRALAKMTRFNGSDSPIISKTVFSNAYDFVSQVAMTRLEVYRLLDDLITKHRTILKEMGGSFVDGLVELSARETDPRNLMICFSIFRIVMIEFQYNEEQTTALWDSVSRYFPITFRPKPNDPIGITADDLKLRLRGCIAATSAFAALAFPFLIQKLDDQTIANVKKDVMRTMAACAEEYDPATLALWSFQIWEALKYEVLSATDDDLAEEALVTLQAVATRLSYGLTLQTFEDTPLFLYVSLIIKDCNGYLREPQQRNAKQSGQILAKIAASSPLAFHLIIKEVLPALQTIYQDANSLAKKRDLLDVINGLFDARLTFSSTQMNDVFTKSAIFDDAENAPAAGSVEAGGFHYFKDSLLEMFTIALTNTNSQETSLRLSALRGLLSLAKISQYLSRQENTMIIQNLTEQVLDEKRTENKVRDQAITALHKLSSLYPQSVADVTFPAMLATLPDVLSPQDDSFMHLSTLEALGKISSGGSLFEIFSRRLLNKLDAVFAQSPNLLYPKIILIGLLYGIKQHAASETASMSANQIDAYTSRNVELYRKIVENLYKRVTVLGSSTPAPGSASLIDVACINLRPLHLGSEHIYADDEMLELIGKIAMFSVRTMSFRDQTWVVPEILQLFSGVGPQRVLQEDWKWDAGENETLAWMHGQHRVASSLSQAHSSTTPSVVILSLYLMAGLRKEHELPFNARDVCLAALVSAAQSQTLSETCQLTLRDYAALLVNKHNATAMNSADSTAPTPQDYMQQLINRVLTDSTEVSSISSDSTLPVIFSFVMAANLKGDRMVSPLLSSLVSAIEHPVLGRLFASHFQDLLAPSEILCAENHAIMRQLSKQRLFGICVPKLVILFKASGDATIKANCLVALAGILKYTPSDIILQQIDVLLPLLLQTLQMKRTVLANNDDSVKTASIDCLEIAIVQSPSAAESHIKSVTTTLRSIWYNTREQRSTSSADLRARALQCLTRVPGQLRDTVTLPYKQSVLRDLENGAVGDPKRRVRVEAVDCRAAWSNLAEPAGEE